MAPRLAALIVTCTIPLLLAGCYQGSGGQAGISNQTDHFSYGGQVAGKTGTETYTWRNTGGEAHVSWGGQSSSGSFTLTMHDSAGKQVYSKSMSGIGQGGSYDETSPGATGDWKITFQFSGFTGQMGLSVDAHGMGCIPGVPGC